MRRPTARHRRLLTGLALPLSFLVSAGMVWRASNAAFTATTDSPSNQWSASTLSLTNDTTGTHAVTGTLMFNPSNIVPGNSGTWCVNVKNAGGVASSAGNPIKFYAPLPANLSSNTLAQNLNLTVTESTTALTGGAAGSCTGYTAGNTVYSGLISAAPASYAAASAPAGTGALTAGSVKGYQLTWSMPSNTPNSVAGTSLTAVDFAWAMQIGT